MVYSKALLRYTDNMFEVVNLNDTIYRQKELLRKLEKAAALGPEGTLWYRRYPNGVSVPYLIRGSREKRERKRLDPSDRAAIEILRDKTLALRAIPKLKEHIRMLEAAQGYEDFNLYVICKDLGSEFWESADRFHDRIAERIPNPAFDNLGERQNTYSFDGRSVTTELGEFRSKSESLDAEYILETGCRFKYEPMILLGSKRVCPEFGVDRFWRRDVGFIEHLGLIDKPDYREKKLQDIKDMADHGIYPGIHLLIISESRKEGFDARLARIMIRAFCMP